MQRTFALQRRFPMFYNHEILTWRRKQLGWSIQETARRARMPFETVRFVFQGKATGKQAYPVARILGLDWPTVNKLDLKEPEFHVALRESEGASSIAA